MKKKETKIEYHQHVDEQGRVFGKSHPLNAKHKKANTQKYHDYSIKQ